jgi:hypothetical protein
LGVWVPDPGLEQGEELRWQRGANRTQGSRAIGGRLFLTSWRLVFMPNRLDALLGARPWAAPLAAVRGVGVQPRDGNAFSGGLRSRLRLDFDHGPELFVINNLDDVVAMLRAATAQPHG